MIDFFQFSNELLCVADERGYFVQVNPAWTATLGWSAEELMSRPYIDFVHPDDREKTLEEARRLFDVGYQTIRFENRYQCRDGSYKWLAWMAKTEPSVNKVIATARDVTEQKQQADALRISEERLRLVMRATNDAIWDCDLDSGTVWWNESYDRCFGHRPPDTKYSWDWWTDHVHPDDRERVVASLQQAMKEGSDRWDCEYRYQRTSGDYADIHDRALVARDRSGRVTRVLGAMLDITKVKNSERELQAKARTIRRLFQLQEQQRRLVSYDIHDGLAQLIIAASMQLEAFRARMENSEKGPLTRAHELLKQAIGESRRLINDLRPMIIDERGVSDSIRHLIAEWERNSTCEFDFSSDLKTDHFEPLFDGVVFRIVQEAVTNAIRHGLATEVRIMLRQTDQSLSIDVDDNGTGFDWNSIPHDRFGVRGIIERASLFGGKAEFDTQPGRGTRLHVNLHVPPWSS